MFKNENALVSTLALLWTIGGIIFFFCAASGAFKGTESMQTQITQGMFGICMLICGFYWGYSQGKKNTPASNNIQAQDNTQITVQNPQQDQGPTDK